MRVLFIGSFLSRQTGTMSIAEKLAEDWLYNQEITVKLSSRCQNRVVRLAKMLLDITFFRGSIVHVDVFSGNAFWIAMITALAARIRRKRLVLTLRGGAIVEDLSRRTGYYRRILKLTQHVQSPSKFICDGVMNKLGIQVSYLANPVKLDLFTPPKDIKRADILWVRAFSEIYNPELAVRTLGMLVSEFPDLKLTMIGPDKGLLEDTEILIDQLDLKKRINILGPVRNQDLVEHYQKHAVYLNTPSYESFGTAVIEAAATSMAIVSTRVGELPLLWNHEENILFSEDLTAESLAIQVRKLLKNQELAKTLGNSARYRATSFDWKVISDQWIETLRSVLDE